MPNWVYNHLAIEGNDSDIIKLKNQLNTPITRDFTDYKSIDGKLERIAVPHTFSNPVFAFWNIIKPEDMNAYIFEEDTGIPKDGEEWFTGNGWYDWNVRNWGTKWDVAVADDEKYPDTYVMEQKEDFISYRFDTAWAMPLNAIKTLSTQYPSLKFSLSYEEETSWGGEVEFTNGNMVEINEYEYRCECGEEYKETPELDDDGQCPECAKEEVNG